MATSIKKTEGGQPTTAVNQARVASDSHAAARPHGKPE